MKNSFLQTQFWADIKKSEGWATYLYKDKLFVLVRSFKAGFKIAYIPHGMYGDFEGLKSESKEICKILPKKTLFIRWDLPIEKIFSIEEGIDSDYNFNIKRPFKKATMDIQPPNTVILDIAGSDDDIKALMHKKTRYNMRLAERKGVVVSEVSIDRLPEWYNLYEITAKRDKIAIHSLKYYTQILENSSSNCCEDQPLVKLYLAEHEDDVLAGIIVCFYKETATYLYGASSNNKRNLMPAYLLQWFAICEAKKKGCTNYDLFGIPPANDKNHPMYGLYRFKTGFGGDLVHRPGAWDYPINRSLYLIFNILEKARYFYFKKLKKR